MSPVQNAAQTTPTATYCTPDDVAETLDLPNPNDPYGIFYFDDTSHPSRDRVVKMIKSNEDIIDRRIRKSWRVNRVKDKIFSINNYWGDINGWRREYYQQGGEYVQLRKNVLEWDPSQGDKMEYRLRSLEWIDISNNKIKEGEDAGRSYSVLNIGQPTARFWFDYDYGKLYIRTFLFQSRANSIRISYRYGSDEEVPAAINRLCCLMTASQIINMQVFNTKVGAGGSISGVKDELLRGWQEEMNQIWTSYQRIGSVHSLLR